MGIPFCNRASPAECPENGQPSLIRVKRRHPPLRRGQGWYMPRAKADSGGAMR